MTTFMLFMYFLFTFAPSGFTSAQFHAIDRAFTSASAETARQQSSQQLVPPSPTNVTYKPLAKVPGAQFAPTVSQVVPNYKSPVKARISR